MDPQIPVIDVRSLGEVRTEALAEPRVLALLVSGVALLALGIGGVGVYGIIAFSVRSRRREFGVRRALGASEGHVVGLVLGQGAKLAAIGIALGLGAALLAVRAMQGLLFGISAHDPLTFAAVPLVLAATALLASWLPARRASPDRADGGAPPRVTAGGGSAEPLITTMPRSRLAPTGTAVYVAS